MVLTVTLVAFALTLTVVISGYLAATRITAVEERLQRFAPTLAPVERTTLGMRIRAVTRMGLDLVGRYGFVTGDRSLAQTLSAAGYRAANAATVFLGVRTVFSFGPAIAVLAYRTSKAQPLGWTAMYAFGAWALGHLLVNSILSRRAKRRINSITYSLPDALDLMVVSLESGLGLNATIARVGEERASMDDPLGLEFAQAALELRSGRSREEALRALGDRNGVEDLKSLAALIVQSDRLGASIAKTLRVHADMLRTKRRQRAEELARKLPIKVLLPLGLFILPALFMVATGPAFLRFREVVGVIQGVQR